MTVVGPGDQVDQSDRKKYPAPKASAEDDLRGQVRVMADPLVEVAVRVYAEFADGVTVNDVLGILDRCRKDLDTASVAALPEMVERLARQRLAAHVASPAVPDGASAHEKTAGTIGHEDADPHG